MSKISSIEKMIGAAALYNAEISTEKYSIYSVKTFSGKLIFDVKVDHQTLKISLIMPDASVVETNGKASMVAEMSLEGVHRHVSGRSVRSYIYSRLSRFMADYYVK